MQFELALLRKFLPQLCNLAASLLLYCFEILALSCFFILREHSNLIVTRFQLGQYLVEINIFEDLQVLHLVLKLVDTLAARILVLLEARLLVVQIL